jgi:pimeloyl-ACP methyl ester carboxylesterase
MNLRVFQRFAVVITVAACSTYHAVATAQQVLDLSYALEDIETVTVDGTELRYVSRGAGSPVVLVHGQLSDFRFWKALIEEGADRHVFIAYSRRYFYPNPSSRSLPHFDGPKDVTDLIGFIEALNVSSVHLVGHSSGGHAALLAAIERPELVRSLVLAEGGFLAVPGVENAGVAASRRARALLEAGEDEQAVRTFIDTANGAGAFDRMTEVDRQANLDNRMALGAPISPPPSCEEVGSIAIPTIIVRGDSSPEFINVLMNALSECLPTAERVTIPRSSHAMFLDNPEAFNAAVLRFIGDNDR